MNTSLWKVGACAVVIAAATRAGAAVPETIGPFTVVDVPVSASLIVGDARWMDGDPTDSWLNVVNVPLTVNDAFSGPGIADTGYANGGLGNWIRPIVQMNYGTPVVNGPGPDLVVFDARFSLNSYAISTDLDGFASELSLPADMFIHTGETRTFFFGSTAGTFVADVMAVAVDLSDLGVPAFGSITAVRLRGVSDEVDPLGVGVIPAPGALTASLLAVTFFARRRR